MRAVERIGPFEHVLRRTPLRAMRVADTGDVPFASRYSLESCHADIEAHIAAIVQAGVIPLLVAVLRDHARKADIADLASGILRHVAVDYASHLAIRGWHVCAGGPEV